MWSSFTSTIRSIWRSPWGKGALAVLLTLVVAIVVRAQLAEPAETAPETSASAVPRVEVITAGSYTSADTQALIGTVRAADSVSITSERAGQVTSAPITLGQSVGRGALIATLENSAERAELTQAEGAYEAAVAGAAANDVSVSEARVGLQQANGQALSSVEQAYATLAALYEEEIDVVVADEDQVYRGVGAITADDQAAFRRIDTAHRSIEQQLQRLRSYFDQAATTEVARAARQEAEAAVGNAQLIATEVRQLFTSGKRDEQYRPEEAAILSQLAIIDGELASTRTALREAGSGIASAEETLARAQLSASGGETSAADAELKQARGSLQAAQSRLAKTIFRSPISGTVNSLEVRAGDFVSANQTIATVANNNALEVVTYITSRERDQWQVGDAVRINGQSEGVVSAIAPVIDPTTGKVEVRISSTDSAIAAGETVRVTRASATTTDQRGPLLVPLTAVKFAATDGHVLTIDGDTLVQTPVTLGAVRGASVEVTEGLGADTRFVRDARGRSAGDVVELIADEESGTSRE